MKVRGKYCFIQLLECCDEELRKDLTHSASGTLTDKTKIEVTEAIKTVAVLTGKQDDLARVALNNMRQDRDTTNSTQSAQCLYCGQAGVCKWDTLECPGCSKST